MNRRVYILFGTRKASQRYHVVVAEEAPSRTASLGYRGAPAAARRLATDYATKRGIPIIDKTGEVGGTTAITHA